MAAFKYTSAFVALAAILLMVMLGQYDTSTGRIEVPGYQAHKITGLTGLSRSEAMETWCVWHNDSARTANGPGEIVKQCIERGGNIEGSANESTATLLLQRYIMLDVLFMISYLTLLISAFKALCRRLSKNETAAPIQLGLKIATRIRGALITLVIACDLTEAIAQWQFSDPTAIPAAWWVTVLTVASSIKWIGVTLVALMLLALSGHLLAARDARSTFWPTVKYLRLQIGAALALALLLTGFGLDQMQDALLGSADHLPSLIATPLSVVLLSVVLWRGAHRLPAATTPTHRGPAPLGVFIAAVVSAGAAFVVFIQSGGRNLFGLVAVLGVVVVLSWFGGAAPWHRRAQAAGAQVDTMSPGERDEQSVIFHRGTQWARWIAAFPMLVLATLMIRSAAVPALLGPERGRAGILLIVGLGLGVSALAIPAALKQLEEIKWSWTDPGSARLYWLIAILCGINMVLAWLPNTRFEVPVFLGPVATASLFTAAATIVGNEMQRWSHRTAPVTAFQLLHLRHTPVFTLLFVWFVVGSLLDPNGHRVQFRPEKSPPPIALATAFDQWAQDNCASGAARSDQEAQLVIVAASGGGIRAAYWTAGVLDKLFPPGSAKPCDRPVFAASGVSGGSLGIMSWVSTEPGDKTSYQQVFGKDHLTAAISWMVNVDVPRSFLGFPQYDRAAVLERSWERAQPALGDSFHAMWRPGRPTTPLVLLNGTAVESGCRALVAPVELGAFDRPGGSTLCRGRPEDPVPSNKPLTGPALIDLYEGYTSCNDVNRSTAALLSARFPYVTPAGRLPSCYEKDSPVHVVDGGYVEASASLTAHDLLETLRPLIDCHNAAFAREASSDCDLMLKGRPAPSRRVRPVLIQIDNGYGSVAAAAAPNRPSELLVPLLGSTAALAAADSSARQRAYAAFGCPYYVRIANVPKPGAQAPLGWTLSRSARSELDAQLDEALRDGPTLGQQLEKVVKHCRTSR
ncbi:hypothetical protein Lesp02_05760 [Lentzea sp. NBRC 105346]|uniref:patatin-like phospholipase family protein n=1 Tax=Lentzea sp. NBRC 105346 TaxID=3032205 RepID=UPI0024A108CB|nr:patatin-like phospholipase family protein [Lentzea sp. NBRC 105346]GLZ28386.1 hypothetical protein Lesp02_05760 [Lentzea sp. NBRC 105346]